MTSGNVVIVESQPQEPQEPAQGPEEEESLPMLQSGLEVTLNADINTTIPKNNRWYVFFFDQLCNSCLKIEIPSVINHTHV